MEYNLKKKVTNAYIYLISAIFAMPFVSAQMLGIYDIRYNVEKGIDIFINFFTPFFEAIIGGYNTNEFFFAKVLILILLFVVIRFTLLKIPQFENQRMVVLIIALVISVLGVRYMNENDLIRGILVPYGTVAIALATVLPFMVFFWFVHVTKMTTAGRRLLWILFGVIFTVLWLERSGTIGSIGNTIYGWTLFAIVIMFLLDRQIHEYFGMFEDRKARRAPVVGAIAHIDAQLNELYKVENPGPEVKERIKHLEEHRKTLKKKLSLF